MKAKPLTYADAGVDLGVWKDTKSRIGRLVASTYNDNVVGKFGQFGGMFDVSALKDYDKPVLVSSIDSVGTKTKIAAETGMYDTVGQDIVNHCIDDILVLGARPLYFLDYIGIGKLSADVAEQIVAGLAFACRESCCVLIGGETAEMPDVYHGRDFDLAGTIVGVVDEGKVVDGSGIVTGDVVIGLRSNGLHTNGYSLARKIVTEAAGRSYHDVFPDTGLTFGEELLRPHRAYTPVLDLMSAGTVKGCAHITGGGFQDNLDRILPQTCSAVIDTGGWQPDPIFRFLQEQGNVDAREMYHTFNMGVGMVLVAGVDDADGILAASNLAGFVPTVVGEIITGDGSVNMKF